MRRALWIGAVLLAVVGVQCTSSSGDSGGDLSDADTSVLEGGSTSDGGAVDESGIGSPDGAPLDTAAPTFAGVKTATALGESQIAVTWDPATDDHTPQGTIAYRIYLGETAGGEALTTPVVTAPAGATSATLSALHAHKAYFIIVRAVDAAGNEDKNVVEATATTMDTQAPTFGGAKTATGTDAHDIKVTWDPATDNGSDATDIHYEVYASATQGGENFTTPTVTTLPGAVDATVTNLPEAAPVFVVVRAVDGAGNRDANKHEVTGNTLDKTAPAFAGLSTAVTLGTTINLAWTAASDNVDAAAAIKYDVFMATSAGGENYATPSFTTLPGATTFAATNLNVSTQYYFVVRAHDSSNNVDANMVEKSATTAASPDVTPPTFAGLATASATTDQTIDLSWTAATDDYAPADQILYDIYLSSAPGGETYLSPSFTTTPGATSFTVTGLSPSTPSYVVVRARDQAGNQEHNTVEKSATTLADTIPPTFAGLVTATPVGPTSIQLSWTAATDDISAASAIKYRVYASSTSGGESFASPTLSVAAGQTSVVVGSLNPQSTYYFVVRAVDEAGNRDTNSIEKSATTLPDTLPPTFGGAVSLVSLSATSVTVSWTLANDDVTPSNQIVYLPYLATSAGGENFSITPTATAAGATSYTFNGLIPNTPYYVVVRARDAAGNVDQNVVEKTTSTQADTTAPTFAGAGSVGSATDQSLKLSWNAATDNSTASANITYLVCVTQTNGGCAGGSFTPTLTLPNGVTSNTFTGLSPSITYYFVVRAKDAYGNIDTNSVQVSGATLADTVAPTFAGLTSAASASPTSITLGWSAGSDDLTATGQLVYDIYQANSAGTENFAGPTYTTSAGATSYVVTGLLPAQTRYFVVRARDQAGNHDANAVEKVATVQNDVTPPTFGGTTSVTSTGLTSLHAAWNAGTDNVTPTASLVYYVCWSTTTSCTTGFTAMATTAAGATSYDITGLTANTTYNVVVRAHDGYGNTDANTNAVAGKTDADVTAPVSPSPPQVTGATATTLTVQWPAATDNYSAQSSLRYLVCMSQSATACKGSSFTATVTLTNQFTYTFTGLTNLQTYYFIVRAEDQANNIDANDNQVSGQTVTDTTPPTFAGLQSATVQSDSSILLSWAAATDNVSTAGQIVYDVYRASSAGGESYVSSTYTSASGATSYLVTGLTPNTTYYFVVRARDAAGNRDTNTVERNAKTAVDAVVPVFAGVTGVAQVSDSQLTASWSAATDDTTASGAITYQVCWAVGSGCTTSFSAMATTAAGATSYTPAVRTLVPNTTYTFVVRAVDAYGNVDANTATANNSTLADTVVPTFAGASSVTGVTYKNATVNWAAASDDYTTAANMRYAICVTQSNGGCNDAAFVAAATVTNQTSYSFTNLIPNSAYYFVVRAEDEAGNFNTTNKNIQVSTTTAQETNAPTFAGASSATTAGPTSVSLSWTNAVDDYSAASQIKYSVYLATSSGAENYASPYVTNIPGSLGVNNFLVTGLSPGTTYYFVVRATDAAGNQETNTTERSATTQATLPSFGTQPYSYAQSTSSLSLAWGASATPAVTITYQYCITTVSGACNNFGSGTSTGTSNIVTVGGLTDYTTYYFVVKATDATGSTYSSQGSATTSVQAPTLSGVVTCNSGKAVSGTSDPAYAFNQFPTYSNITTSSATPGSVGLAASAAYEICWNTSSGGCSSFSALATSSSAPTNLYIGSGGLTPNTTYYVKVRAKDSLGNYSNVVSGTCKTPISGSTNLNPWFSSNCSGCHSWTANYIYNNNTSSCSSRALVDRTSFTLGNSYIYQKTHSNPPACGVLMPQGASTPISTTLLNTWITEGGKNN